MHQTNIKTWLVVASVERLSEASVYNNEAIALHAVPLSVRGTFCMERSCLWLRLTYFPEKETFPDSPPFPSYFPPYAQQITLLEQYLLICLSKKKNPPLLSRNQIVHKTRLWGILWASFDQFTSSPTLRTDKRTGFVTNPGHSVGDFQFWTRGVGGGVDWFFARWP